MSPDYTKMSPGYMYQVLGGDSQKWTDAFFQFNPNVHIERDAMFSWVCNMMMAALDFQHGQPVLNGDHAQWLMDEGIVA